MRNTYRKINLLWLSVVMTIIVLALGCGNAPPINYDVHDPDPSVKIPAIKMAAERRMHDDAIVRQLVKDLDSDDAAIRFYAIEGLRRISGETFGYLYFDDEDERKPAVQKWNEWLAQREGATTRTPSRQDR